MPTDIEQELERTTRLRGFRYGLHDFEALLWGAGYLKKHNDHTEANYLKAKAIKHKSFDINHDTVTALNQTFIGGSLGKGQDLECQVR